MLTTTTESSAASTGADSERIRDWIEQFTQLSEKDGGPGVTRLAYTTLEREAHRIFTDYMRSLGLQVHTDAAGNTIAMLEGSNPSLPVLGTGSHLDSVPTGGSFDGTAGVVAAMEMARILVERGTSHRRTIKFVAFAAEEGARFGQACTGSRIIAGLTGPADLDQLADKDGINLAVAMESVGFDPARVADAVWQPADWAGFVELHIEQGSVLTDAALPVGIVDLISGSTRVKIDLTGRSSHTGGTPMHLRADALTAAAEIVLNAEILANDSGHHGTRITVGRLDVNPGSITTIPGHCQLHIDIRDVDSDRQRQTATKLIAAAQETAAQRGIGISVDLLADASPVVLPVSVRAAITTAAVSLGLDYRVMPSGASHDTQMINHVCPAGMIFVPSQNHGISHSPDELTTYADLARGIDLLAASVLALDVPTPTK